MAEYIALEALGLAVAFGLGFLAGRGVKHRVKVPDYVPEDWKISKDDQ